MNCCDNCGNTHDTCACDKKIISPQPANQVHHKIGLEYAAGTIGKSEHGAVAIMRWNNGYDDVMGRIFAAAPELFDACVRMMVGITRQSTETCEWYEGIAQDAVEEARKAIAKAMKHHE